LETAKMHTAKLDCARECASSAQDVTATNAVQSEMAKKSLKVDRKKFEGIVQNLLHTKPLKRSKVKVSKRKPQQLIPPPRSDS
jgi:hypothetical protein